MIVDDPFDSEITGKYCGFVVPGPGETQFFAERDLIDFDHVRVEIDMAYSDWYHRTRGLESLGFKLASVRVTYQGPTLDGSMLDEHALTLCTHDEDVHRIVAEGSMIFGHSRFHTDPFYDGPAIRRVHERWLQNLISSGRLYMLGTDGFIGFNRQLHGDTQILEIELIGKLSKRHSVGQILVRGLCAKVPADTLVAKTQAYNLRAVELYQRLGMRQTKTEAIFSWSR